MSHSTGKIHVLHVDDEPNLTELVADLLEREDNRISVTTAGSAREGFESLTETDIDCVISDYDMPGQNGIEFLETVREDWGDLPFILYTGKGTEEVASDAISAGVTDYLQKGRGTEQYSLLANRVLNAVQRYRATQYIERQNDLFRKAQDIATVGVWEYDIGTETVYNSEQVFRIHGLSPDEDMSAEESLRYYHPDDRPLIRNAFQQAIEAGESYDLEVRLIDDDGNQRWIRTRGEPQTEDGKIVRVRGTIQDITDRKEREQNLVQFKQAAEHAGHAVYVTDSEATIEYVNPAFEQITGYAAEEALGKTPQILKSGEMSDGYYEELWESVLAGEIWEENIVNRRKNGELYHAYQTIAPILDEDDEIEAFVAIQTDITEKKEERERLDFLESLETQLTELASDLLQIDQKSTGSKINEALETIGTLVDADRSYVFQIDHGEETLSNTHEWTAEGIEPQIDALQDIPHDTLPWWMEKMGNHETLTIPAVSQLPPEAGAEQEILQEQNIKSLIVAPMVSEDELVGFIGFDWVEQQDAWSEDFIYMLEISGEILSSAIQRESRRRELERREAYLEQSSDIISVTDSNGAVTYQSASTERATGFSPGEVIGDSGFEHVHPEDIEKLEGVFSSFVAQPNTEVQEELRVETKDGDWRWIEVRGVNKLDDPVINGLLFSFRDITERKETQEALRESEKRYRRLIESQNDLIVRVDAENRFTFVNDTYCEFFGKREEELLGKKFTPLIHEDDIEETMNAMENLEEPPHRVTVEQRAMTEEGWRWIHWEDSAVLNENGKIEEIQAVGRDITDRKERERRIEELKERLELAIEGAGLGVWDWDMTTDEVEFNEQWAQMLGCSLDEIKPHLDAWEKRVHPDDVDDVEAALDAHIAGETDYYDTEHRMRTADGDWKWIRDVGEIIERDADGKPVRAVGIHIDIDERKQRERKLRQFRKAVEQTAHMVYITDTDGIIEYVNPAFEEVTGFSESEAVGQDPGILQSGEHGDEYYEELWETILSGEQWADEMFEEGADGEEIVLNQTISPITDEDGQPQKFVAVGQDTTQQKEYEQKLEDQRDNLEVLNQVVRHDIRNDMAVVSGRAELLEEHVEEAGKEDLEAVQDSVESATGLTKTARDLSEIMLSTEEDVGPVRLDQYLNPVIKDIRAKFEAAVITTEGQIPETHVRGNELLEGVFRNLIHNAVIHNDEQRPEVRISTRIDEETTTVRVADNGPGIPDTRKKAIFGKGQKGLDSPGTGVGLYLVRTLVEQYGGDVWVEDNDPEGSVFFVELPLTEAATE